MLNLQILLKYFPEKIAIYGLIIILSLILLMHVMVFVGLLPYEMVWGGRLKTKSDMVIFEAISLFINALMLSVVLIRAGILKIKVNILLLKLAFWVMVAIYSLNTLGNLASLNTFERLFFSPLTLILAIFSWRLTIFEDTESNTQPIK